MKFFGYVVFDKGVYIDLDKIEVVRIWFVLKIVKEVRFFLGFCFYYR